MGPLAIAAVAGGVGLVSSFFGGKKQKKDMKKAEAQIAAGFDQAQSAVNSAFSRIGSAPGGLTGSSAASGIGVPFVGNAGSLAAFDPTPFIKGIGSPEDTSRILGSVPNPQFGKHAAALNPFNPMPFVMGNVPPSLERMLREGTIDQSEFAKIAGDPRLKDAQMKALAKVQEIAESNGLTLQDRVKMREMLDTIARQTRMQQHALRQKYEAQGLGGSGVELASSLAAEQGAVEGAHDLSGEIFAAAKDREFQAIQEAARLAGAIRSQDFDEASRKAEAIDAINRFNAAQRSDALKASWEMNQRYGESVANAGQTYYANQVQRAGMLEDAEIANWDSRFRKATAMAEARRAFWAQKFQYGEALANAGQTAWANEFTRRKAQDDAAYQNFQMQLSRAAQLDDWTYRQWDSKMRSWSANAEVNMNRARINADIGIGKATALGGAAMNRASQPNTLQKIGDTALNIATFGLAKKFF